MRDSLYDDAALYDAQYARYRDDLPFYRRLAEDYGGPILELGAGTGRVTVELARCGVDVVALERSEAMLDRARRRLGEAGLDERVRWLLGDMRRSREALVAHGLAASGYAVVAAPFHTLAHLLTMADQDATLAQVGHLLAPDGVFGCDMFHPDEVLDQTSAHLRREASFAGVAAELGIDADLWLEQRIDRSAQIVESRYVLDRVAEDGHVFRTRRSVTQRWYTHYELVRLLQLHGLSRIRAFGDFDRRPYGNGAARLVILAMR